MPKRTSLNDKLKEETKTAKVIAAFTTSEDVLDNPFEGNSDQESEDVNNDVSESVNNFDDEIDYGDVDNEKKELVIEVVSKKSAPKRATYYLLPHTLKKIDKLSKQTGVGKSELVQRLLDDALNRVKIK